MATKPASAITLMETEWRPDDGSTGSIARLIVPGDGHSVLRTIITGNKGFATGLYPSVKTHRTQYWEGLAEQSLIYDAEADPRVVDYQMNGHALEFAFEGAHRHYTFDQVRQYEDGRIEAIEAKSHARSFKDTDYGRLLGHVAELLGHVGWGFRRVVTESIFSTNVHRKNVHEIQSRRFVEMQPRHFDVVDGLRRRGVTTIAYTDLVELLEPNSKFYGRGVIAALHVRREVEADVRSSLMVGAKVHIRPTPTPVASLIRFQ